MAPKDETSPQENATDCMTGECTMVDVPTSLDHISAGNSNTKAVNHSVTVLEHLQKVCEIDTIRKVEDNACKVNHDATNRLLQDTSSDVFDLVSNKNSVLSGEEAKGVCLYNNVSEPPRSSMDGATDELSECSSSNDPSAFTKEGSLTMSLYVEGTALPPDLWHAAVKKEPVNVWILQVAENDLSPDSKTSFPLQVVLPLDQTWSWDSELDPISSDDEEPPTYTTLQTVSWDDVSCYNGQLKDEIAGSSVFSDDEEMSSMTGDNFQTVGSDGGLITSSSDGDLRMLLQPGMKSLEDSWCEDANTFALTELRLGSDADSRCSIDTDRIIDQSSSLTFSRSKEHFSCPLCHKIFTDQLNFKYHKRTHKDRKLFTCDLCNQKFAREKTLERHRLTHSVPVRPVLIDCPFCSERFEQRVQLRTHVRALHRDETSEVGNGLRVPKNAPFTCEICRKSFTHETRLKHHQELHYERQYKCHICTVTLATKHSLRRHLYIHSGEKPFCCETCGKSFAFELYLRNHMKKHLTFKFHDCAFCPERFCSRRELKSHLIVHRGQYHCQVCKESFRSKHKLQDHMHTHET